MPCPAPKVGGALFAVQACPDQAAGERHGYKADLALRASGYKAVLVLENCLGIVILLTVVERSGFVKYYCPVLVAEAKVEEPRIAGRRTGAKRSSAKPTDRRELTEGKPRFGGRKNHDNLSRFFIKKAGNNLPLLSMLAFRFV